MMMMSTTICCMLHVGTIATIQASSTSTRTHTVAAFLDYLKMKKQNVKVLVMWNSMYQSIKMQNMVIQPLKILLNFIVVSLMHRRMSFQIQIMMGFKLQSLV
jgi:hypothetical protein